MSTLPRISQTLDFQYILARAQGHGIPDPQRSQDAVEALHTKGAKNQKEKKGNVKCVQADTYRRMRKATKGDWAGFHPATNCLWVHYVADTLLSLKAFPSNPDQKKQLRGFR
jgi:hypothetical protein